MMFSKKSLIFSAGVGILALFGAMGLGTRSMAQDKNAEAANIDPAIALAVAQASTAISNRDCPSALKPLAVLWDNKAFNTDSAKMAQAFRLQRILCLSLGGETKQALALSSENLKTPNVEYGAHNMHVLLLLEDKQEDAAVKHFERALSLYPDQLADMPDYPTLSILYHTHEKDRPSFGRLMDTLLDVGFEAKSLRRRSFVRLYRLERLREIDNGTDEILKQAYRNAISDQSYFYILSLGDGNLSQPKNAVKSARTVLDQEIIDAKISLMKNPQDLDDVVFLADLYQSADQEQLVVSLINHYFEMIDKIGLLAFENTHSYQNLLVRKASLLANLGRYDEALAAFKDAEIKLAGQENLEFYAGYMNYLIDTGHENDALALEPKIDITHIEDEEKHELNARKACAYAYLKDTSKYNETMKLLPTIGYVRLKPLLCARDSDGAAKTVIAMMGDKKMRDEVIILLQDSPAPKPWTPRDQAYVNAYMALKKRPDVLAAAKAAKIVIRKWDIYI